MQRHMSNMYVVVFASPECKRPGMTKPGSSKLEACKTQTIITCHICMLSRMPHQHEDCYAPAHGQILNLWDINVIETPPHVICMWSRMPHQQQDFYAPPDVYTKPVKHEFQMFHHISGTNLWDMSVMLHHMSYMHLIAYAPPAAGLFCSITCLDQTCET